MQISQLNNLTKNIFIVFLTLVTSYCFAAGGLEPGTTAINTVKTWLYSFLGAVALLFILYNVLMTFMERKTWGDVAMAIAAAAGAGGCILAGEWAWSIWGG